MSTERGPARRLALGSPAGRWLLAATVLGSGMALLDTTTVTVALPAIGRDLGGGLATLQWVLDAYLLGDQGSVDAKKPALDPANRPAIGGAHMH